MTVRYLSLKQVLTVHQRLLATSGGADGIRDLGRLEAALAQPKACFDDQELYPTLVGKSSALAYSLIQGHAFVDGNKRVGHAAMALMLRLNGYRILSSVDEQENLILGVASGTISGEQLTQWLSENTVGA